MRVVKRKRKVGNQKIQMLQIKKEEVWIIQLLRKLGNIKIGDKTFKEKDIRIKNEIKQLQESLQRNIDIYQNDMEVNLTLISI